MTKEDNIRILLKNFVNSQEDIEFAFLYSNQGLMMAKYSRFENSISEDKEVDAVYGALTALVENLMDKISLEYEIGHYGSGSFETSEHRIIYLEAGSDAILLLACNYNTNLNKMLPVAYLVVEKIAQLLEDSFDFKYNSLSIPELSINDSFSLNLGKYSINNAEPILGDVKPAHQFTKSKPIQKLFKLIILGSAAVGKTTLVNRFLKKDQIIDYRPTLGISISTQQYHVQGFKDDIIKFLIYDLAGQEFFKRVRHEYYKGANCAFVVYDVTRRETFDEALDFWFQDARKELGNVPFVLIGNKVDLEDLREVSREEGLKKAEGLRSFFIETSALKNINVQDTFKIIGIGLFFKYIDEA